MADDALRLGPEICISCELKNRIERNGSNCTVTKCGIEITKHKTKNPNKPRTTRKSPSQICVSPRKQWRSNSRTGPEPKQEQPNTNCHQTERESSLYAISKDLHRNSNELRTSTMSNRRKDSCEATLENDEKVKQSIHSHIRPLRVLSSVLLLASAKTVGPWSEWSASHQPTAPCKSNTRHK